MSCLSLRIQDHPFLLTSVRPSEKERMDMDCVAAIVPLFSTKRELHETMLLEGGNKNMSVEIRGSDPFHTHISFFTSIDCRTNTSIFVGQTLGPDLWNLQLHQRRQLRRRRL